MRAKTRKLLQIAALFCIYIIVNVTVVHALAITHNSSSDVTAAGAEAQIRWTTDAASDSNVEYGTSNALGSTQSDSTPMTSHTITLTGLGAAQTYYYKLASSGNGEVATADNLGSLYSFTTPAASASADTAPPQFNVSLPEYYNRRQITFGGYTDPDSILRLYVNQNQADIGTDRYTQLTTSDSSGHFIFKYINLAQENNIIIWAKDPAGNTNTATYKVIVDTEDPVVQMNELPLISASTSLSVNGTVNEDVVVTIAVNNDTKTQEAKAGNFNLQLSLREGVKNRIDLQFSDKAGNVFEKEYIINVDTQGPRIVWNNLGALSPSYIQDVEVEGNVTKPGATIIVFVNNKTYSSQSWSTSVRDMFVNYGSILTEGNQEYVAKADANGHFKIRVFLTQEIASAKTEFMQDPYKTSPTSTQTPPGGAPTTYGTSTTAGQITAGSTGRYSNAWDNTLVIVAFDELGRSDKTSPAIVTFARCGYGSDWNIQVKNPTPSVITPEHLRQGIAQIAFAVNLEWQGTGKNQKILGNPVIQQYKLSDDMKKNYVFDPNQLMSNRPNGVWSPDMKRGYVVIDLNKKDYQQKNLSHLKKEDLILKLPLQIEIRYQYDDGTGALVTGVQKQCWDVSTVLDVQIPPSVIPKELLNASVQFLNSTISAIDRILKPLKVITIVVFVTCLLSWVMYFIALMKKAYDCMDSKQGKESQACLESRESAKKVEKYMHYVCDRIFCPSAPTADYYFQEMSPTKECKTGLTPSMSKNDNGCGQEYMDQWDSSCLLMNELERSKCIRYQEGDSQFQESCAESGQMLKNIWYGASDFCRKKDQQTNRMFSVTSGSTTEQYVIENGKARKIVSSTTAGGITKAEGGGYVQSGAAGATTYNTGPFDTKRIGQKDYSLDDYDDQGRLTFKDKTGRSGYICKDAEGKTSNVYVPKEGESLNSDSMKKCNAMTLPPELMQTLKLPQTRKYVVNPTDNLLTALQCVCLPAINGFLSLWRNMLGAIMQCFQSILVTGDGSTGLCRAVLTTYLCDIIFNAIRCFVNKYGAGMASREDPKSGVSAFFKSAATAGTDIQKSISGRYGPSALYKTMFSERKLINAVCLWAFTGDFDFDIGTALTGAGAIPLKSKAFLYPRTRRFIASNPLTGYTTHIYHIGAGLVAGANMGYKLQLVCSATSSCNPTEGFPNGQCDCWNKKEDLKDITSSFGPGRLNAGEMLGPNEGDIYIRVSEAKYRYDKVRLTYWYTDNQGAQQTVVEEGDIAQIGGNPPAECSFDLAAGVFRCAYEIGDMGYALFPEVPKPDKNRYGLGDVITLSFKVDKRSPQKPQEGPATYINYDQLPFFIVWSIIPLDGAETDKKKIIPIISEGITDYSGILPKITVTEDLIMGRGIGKDYEPFQKPSDASSLLKVADFDSSGMTSSERPDFALYAVQTVSEETLKKDPEKKDNIEPYRVFKVKVCEGEVKDKEVSGQIKKEFIQSGSCVEVSEESGTEANGLKFESRPNSKIMRVTYKGMWVDLTYESIPLPAKKGKIVWNGIIMRHLEEVKGTLDCRTKHTSANPAKLTIKIGLYPCRAKDDQQPKSIVNCDPDTTPVNYFGTVQEHEISVDLICSKGDQEVQYRCPLGVKLDSPCECKQEITGKNDCGPGASGSKGDYCFFDAVNWVCKKYAACPRSTAEKPVFINDYSKATLIEAGAAGVNKYYCDCSSYPDMEDCTAKYCYPKGGEFGCYPDPPAS